MPGRATSAAEVTHVSRHGFWLLLGDEELLVPFTEFPWFVRATIGQLRDVEWPTPDRVGRSSIRGGPTSRSPRTRGRLAGAAPVALPSFEPRLHAIEGKSAALLDALVDAATTLDGANRLYALLAEPADPMLGLVDDLASGTPPPDQACDALRAATDGVRAALPNALARVPRTRRNAQHRDALARAGLLLREVGLEQADADVHLATDARGQARSCRYPRRRPRRRRSGP